MKYATFRAALLAFEATTTSACDEADVRLIDNCLVVTKGPTPKDIGAVAVTFLQDFGWRWARTGRIDDNGCSIPLEDPAWYLLPSARGLS